MNRQDRRAARLRPAQARVVAAVLAAACFDRMPDGGQRAITHPLAVRALGRGFSRCLMERGEPQLLRLSHEEGAAFPSCAPEHRAPRWAHWLAVGFDRQERGTFALQAILAEPNAPVAEHRAVAWAALSPRLTEEMRSAWVPT